MKKRLEADLTSIAHRILQLKNKSDINQLYLETQKLYEKLSVLKFIEENYRDAQPTIGNYSQIEDEIETIYDNTSLPAKSEIEIIAPEPIEEAIEVETADVENSEEEIIVTEEEETEGTNTEFQEEEPEIETVKEEKIEEELTTEEIEENNIDFKPSFQLSTEPETEDSKKSEAVQISFEDLLGGNYNEPQFVKVDDVPAPAKDIAFEPVEKVAIPEIKPTEIAEEKIEKTASKVASLNEKFSKGIEIDLNDRIAFTKHLFGNSTEDYNRVLSQLITYNNFYETKTFIEEMVKPDYNNWEGKEEYEERFMDIIEKKFL